MRVLQRMRRAEAELPARSASPAVEPAAEVEAAALGRELARIAVEEIRKLAPADPRPRTPEAVVQRIEAKPPAEVSFHDLETLAQHDERVMQAVWQRVKSAAQTDVDSGWRAGRAVAACGDGAAERAGFLAIREAFRTTWPPRSPAESLLIDELAQYEILRHAWMHTLTEHTYRAPSLRRQRAEGASGGEPTLSQAAATREAVLNVERLQRLFQRTLRTLQSLRRGQATIVVRQAQQVNLTTGPQLNVGATEPGAAADHS